MNRGPRITGLAGRSTTIRKIKKVSMKSLKIAPRGVKESASSITIRRSSLGHVNNIATQKSLFFEEILKDNVIEDQVQIESYIILIKDIYGSSDHMTLAAIELLNDKNHVVPSTVEVVESEKNDYSNIHLLSDQMLVKHSNECFIQSWDGNPIIFEIKYQKGQKPVAVRIWNVSDDPSSHVKNVCIIKETKLINSATIPSGYGINMSLATIDTLEVEYEKIMFLKKQQKESIWPLPITQHISLTFYAKQDKRLVFNFVEIFEISGSHVNLDFITAIRPISCQLSHPITSILERKKATNIIMMIPKGKQQPRIEISLAMPVRIALIRFWNCLSYKENDDAVERLKIDLGQVSWIGKPKMLTEATISASASVTEVFFIDRKSLNWAKNLEDTGLAY